VKVQGSYTFEAPLETVWNALFDPEILARTLPGCDKLEREGNSFKGDINVRMGPVQGKFQGKVDIVDVKDRESYTMVVDGRGPAGFGKATALLRVAPSGSGTRLDYDSDVQVGGKIASVGQRLIDASSRAIVKQSLDSLHEQIKALPPSVIQAGAVVPAPAANPAPAAQAEPALPIEPGAAAGAEAAAGSPGAAPAAAAEKRPPRESWFDASSGAVAVAAGAPPPAAERAPGRAPARGPSQAAFALGVAKEVTKELFPIRVVLLVIGGLILLWLLLRALSG
jgi:carbon monoxide dehydrogenase subunit G